MLKIYVQDTKGKLVYRHDTGVQSYVTIEIAGMSTREIRIATLPPEIHDRVIRETLSKYGEVTDTKEEQWTKIYRCKASNGIRLVRTRLRHHLPIPNSK
jgi:predicted aspartyl protease